MQFTETPLEGAFILDPQRIGDSRGFFARIWAHEEMAQRGLETRLLQFSASFNAARGTLRGMHYQAPPFDETKIVRCTRGALYDVIVDLREGSRTYRRWHAIELSAESLRMIYIPTGFAHGFLTLSDDTEIQYFISQVYSPAHARGVRWDDPALGIQWPFKPTCISERDMTHPLLGGASGAPR